MIVEFHEFIWDVYGIAADEVILTKNTHLCKNTRQVEYEF